jgi:RNA polymerase sigma-70 factor, ECF subfamily
MSSSEQLTDLRSEAAFAALFERHRRELQVHSYRMLGSFEDCEEPPAA